MDTNVQTRDLLGRVDLTMDEAIGGVIFDGSVQVGKSLDVLHGHPVVHPYLRCLADGQQLDGQNGKVRRNRVVGRRGHGQIRV